MAVALTFEAKGHLTPTMKEFAIFEVVVMHQALCDQRVCLLRQSQVD